MLVQGLTIAAIIIIMLLFALLQAFIAWRMSRGWGLVIPACFLLIGLLAAIGVDLSAWMPEGISLTALGRTMFIVVGFLGALIFLAVLFSCRSRKQREAERREAARRQHQQAKLQRQEQEQAWREAGLDVRQQRQLQQWQRLEEACRQAALSAGENTIPPESAGQGTLPAAPEPEESLGQPHQTALWTKFIAALRRSMAGCAAVFKQAAAWCRGQAVPALRRLPQRISAPSRQRNGNPPLPPYRRSSLLPQRQAGRGSQTPQPGRSSTQDRAKERIRKEKERIKSTPELGEDQDDQQTDRQRN